MATTSLLTDHYELTMLQAALASGTAHRRCTFEVFTRRLPAGRRYGVLAGTGRFLEGLQSFRFDDEDLSFLASRNIVNAQTLKYLESFRFTGNIRGYVEGEIFFPHSPVVQVEATFAEACVLETYLLSILNYDSAVASAASRMTAAAGHRPCIEMGSRRAHERAAVSAARAAAIAGFTATSNLEAGRRYGLHTLGTSAHAFTLLYDSEREAFEAQLQSLGARTTLLADTYDVENAVRLGVELAGEELGGVRLDSGDLVASAQRVRELLDSLGNHNTKITVTSDLDEYAIASLAAAPVDSYGVGTRLVTGSGAPTSAMVYKLVERENTAGELEPVAKTSAGKRSLGGAKQAARRHNSLGIATAELIGTGNNPAALENTRDLIRDFVVSGELLPGFTGEEAVRTATERHSASLAELPESARRLSEGEPVIPTEFI
ncbi:nicotinate phosphoribosyltransferase [Rothia dentocariosa]|nr:nicotinate phosphoribosyltransferase [Rothia dentocariosa]NLR25525.1 nicotinate phosphoribosyltransferase [Rothia dentocariosa]